MTHTDFRKDLDPNTPDIKEQVGHFHYLIKKWECLGPNDEPVSQRGAETEVQVRFFKAKEYQTVAVVEFPQHDVPIFVNQDGYVEARHRQRPAGGQWAPWTDPLGVEVNLQPPAQPIAPTIYVGESDGKSTMIEAEFVYPDVDLDGNVIKPAEMLIQILKPCADTGDGWETVGVVKYPTERFTFSVPVMTGTRTFLARVVALNICDIRSEPSEVTEFDIHDSRFKSSGEAAVERGCLS